ncbi:MAG: zinc ABC transporter substrate-binding protein [Ruminococcaceae bacterium]|nr:zinc ABC transporter substrate-binding protein [Oscillospiraceae bacterium]
MNIGHKTAKVLLLGLVFLWMVSLFTGCVSIKKGNEEPDGRLYVVCTVFPQYDFIKNIAGDRVRLEILLPPGTDTHNYGLKDISISQLDRISRADLFVFVGGESDEQLREELRTAIKEDTAFLTLLSLIDDPLCENEADHSHESDHHDHDVQPDEHVWTSPKRAMELVDDLTKQLCRLDPDGEKIYQEGARIYREKLAVLDAQYEQLKESRRLDTLIFADRFPFRYLCSDYDITAHAAFSGCASDVEPSLSRLDELYNKAMELSLPAILYMEGSTPVYAEKLAERIGKQALMLHSCHVLREEEQGKTDYITLMEQNLSVLQIALGVN